MIEAVGWAFGRRPSSDLAIVRFSGLVNWAMFGFLATPALVSAVLWRHGGLPWLGLATGSLIVASMHLYPYVSQGMAVGPERFLLVAIAFLAASALATLQTAIWAWFGWHLVRVRRRSASPGA